MKNNLLLCAFLMASLLTGCSDSKRDAIGRTEVVIETSEGDIVVRLYDDTPGHRDNFVRNVEAHLYDGILFNRIVPDMVIQAGDTALRVDADGRQEALAQGAASGGGAAATIPAAAAIPAEIVYPRHFHRQGVLAAAREPDSINPRRESSALQWYIVTGKKYTAAELAELQALLYEGKVAARFEALQRSRGPELDSLRSADREAQQTLLNALQTQAENELAANPPQPFTDVQKQSYARFGGAPHLDGDYTVFGEIVDGLPVALRIGRTPVDAHERPRRQVYIKKVRISRRP